MNHRDVPSAPLCAHSSRFLSFFLSVFLFFCTCTLLTSLLLFNTPHVSATVTCTWNATACGTTTRLLGVQNDSGGYLTNSHAELATNSNYTASVCCSIAGASLTATCGTTVLRLATDSNSHAAQANETSYPLTACLAPSTGTLTCLATDTTCPIGYGCVGSMANTYDAAYNGTNAHLGNCTAYTRKVCCTANAPPTHTTPILNASDNPLNRTSATLTAWNQSTSDPNGDPVTNIHSFALNGSPIAILLYPFDTNEASTSTGAIRDYARGHNGTLVNAPVWTSSGIVGGAFVFNGNNSYIATPHTPALNYTGGHLTLAAWIRPTSTAFGCVISKPWNDQGDYNYLVRFSSGQAIVELKGGSGFISNGTNVSTNAWSHLATILTPNRVLIYLNGTLAVNDSYTMQNWTPPNGGTGLSLITGSLYPYGEGWSGNPFFTFNGTIDDVRIYNRSLSAAQVQQIFIEGRDRYNHSSIVPEETTKGDNWSVAVTPNDGALDGSTLWSENLTIRNSPPNAVLLTAPANNSTTLERYPTFTWVTQDNDSDVVNSTWTLTSPAGCAAIPAKTTLSLSYTSIDRLCTDRWYNWTVFACDTENACTVNASTFTFSINSSVGVAFTRAAVNFGTLLPSTPTFTSTNTTLTNNPLPLHYNNTGNVDINVSVRADAPLWLTQGLGTPFFRVADENNVSWIDAPAAYTLLFANLTPSQERELEVNVTVPQGEPATAKNTTLRILGVSIE